MDIITVIAFAVSFIAFIAFFRIMRFNSAKLGGKVKEIRSEDGALIVYEKGIYLSKGNIEIPFSDIVAIGFKTISSTETKERSVIGRAIAGNFLFGETGAIVGGMSGLKDKKVDQHSEHIIIETKNNKYVFKSNEHVGSIVAIVKSKMAK